MDVRVLYKLKGTPHIIGVIIIIIILEVIFMEYKCGL